MEKVCFESGVEERRGDRRCGDAEENGDLA